MAAVHACPSPHGEELQSWGLTLAFLWDSHCRPVRWVGSNDSHFRDEGDGSKQEKQHGLPSFLQEAQGLVERMSPGSLCIHSVQLLLEYWEGMFFVFMF